jgi:hypothetical protein
MFKDGRTNVHDEERGGPPSVVSNDLVQSVDQRICERRRFKISEISCEFPQISRTVLYKIITVRLGYQQVLRNVGSENVHWGAQNAEIGFDFDIFRAIQQRWP